MSHRIRRFEASDREPMLAFAKTLPEHDLLFLNRDIRHPKVVDAWAAEIGEGTIESFVAVDADSGELLGTAALVRDPLGWSAHVGEVRLLVSQAKRRAGLGRDLLEAVFALAVERGVEKLSARMTPDQVGSVMLFESLGFRGEALLKDQVRNAAGDRHDVVVLSQDVRRAEAHNRALGLEE